MVSGRICSNWQVLAKRRRTMMEAHCRVGPRKARQIHPVRRLIAVIKLRRLDGSEFMVNAFLVETVEATPDTVVTLTTGRKFVVREPVPVVMAEALEFYRAVLGAGRIITPIAKEGENA